MPVTPDDVAAAYRLLLGREASAQERHAWLHVATLAELRRRFMESAEFRAVLARLPTPPAQRLPGDVASIHVEWQADPTTEARLLDHVTRTWSALGRDRPHWSVLSADPFLPEHMAKNAAAFYASGANEVRLIAGILARHGLTPADLPRAVEYGCGVGRVTPHLAGMFAEVTAIDISETHLALAQSVVLQGGHKNVSLKLARPPGLGMSMPCDLWFSMIVLQHNPPPLMVTILRRMFAWLAPAGVAIFQVPTHALGYDFRLAEYLAAPSALGTIEVHCLPQPVIFQLAQEAGCVPLEVREDTAMGPPSAWLSNTFVFRKRA